MEVIGGIIGVLLVFFVLIMVNAKTKRDTDLGVDEGSSQRHYGVADGMEYGDGKKMPKINVSANKGTLYDEKEDFITTDVKMSIEESSGDGVDNQIFDESDDFGEFSLRDGILYSIILENKVV